MNRILIQALIITGSQVSPLVMAAGRYSEMTINYSSLRDFSYTTNQFENTVTVKIKNIPQQNINSLNYYDEKVIRRLLIEKLHEQDGWQITFYLRDRNLKVNISHLKEPLRALISIFDNAYSIDKDATTGLPLPSTGKQEQTISSRNFHLPPRITTDSNSPIITKKLQHNLQLQQQDETKYKLLQPTPQLAASPKQLVEILSDIPPGHGAAWKKFPIYIYPLKLAPYEERIRVKKITEQNYNPPNLAEYAYSLYRYGNERKSLKVYQQILHSDPSIFTRDALHLWTFAETNLGEGNLTLSDGYFQTLIERFPESPLIHFAQIRRLDIAAIRAEQNNNRNELKALAIRIKGIQENNNPEARIQSSIRRSFWLADQSNSSYPPSSTKEDNAILSRDWNKSESKITSFLQASLILSNHIDNTQLWNKKLSTLGTNYLSRYNDPRENIYYNDIYKKFFRKLFDSIIETSSNQHFIDTITFIESIPAPFNEELQTLGDVAWAAAEAYRNMQRPKEALDYYKISSSKIKDDKNRFKSAYWASVLSEELTNTNPNIQKISISYDKNALEFWKALSQDSQNELLTIYSDKFISAIEKPSKLKTPAIILLAGLTDSLATKQSAAGSGRKIEAFSPNAQTIYLLNNLEKRFQELGLEKQRKSTIKLMKTITPKTFNNDKSAKEIWTKSLIQLAEDYRKDNNFFEAGQLYGFTARNAGEWQDRAEALYKSGILLYRSGRRQDAINAFKESSQDGQNFYYANLAKTQLNQLTKQ